MVIATCLKQTIQQECNLTSGAPLSRNAPRREHKTLTASLSETPREIEHGNKRANTKPAAPTPRADIYRQNGERGCTAIPTIKKNTGCSARRVRPVSLPCQKVSHQSTPNFRGPKHWRDRPKPQGLQTTQGRGKSLKRHVR